MITPFIVNTPQPILDDLKRRIETTRWPDEILNTGWQFGADLSYMKELANYWVNEFDWRKVEHEINLYPNFIAEIEGHKIHFLHIKGKGEKPSPPDNYSWMARFFSGDDENNSSSYKR